MVGYTVWRTDPTTIEILLAWMSFGWGLSIALTPDLVTHGFRYAVMFGLMPRSCWADVLFGVWLVQSVSTALPVSAHPRFKLFRLITAFTSACLWTAVTVAIAPAVSVSPLVMTSAVMAVAAWWDFLRSGDRFHIG